MEKTCMTKHVVLVELWRGGLSVCFFFSQLSLATWSFKILLFTFRLVCVWMCVCACVCAHVCMCICDVSMRAYVDVCV